MSGKPDPCYPQLVKALNLLAESKAKIEFLSSKIDTRRTYILDEEASRLISIAVITEEQLNGADSSASLRLTRDKADSIQRSLFACKEKCDALHGTVQRLIEVKDELLCLTMHESPTSQAELLPDGTRTERMKLELFRELSECSICSETMKRVDAIWSCKSCYNIFHLHCIGLCMDASRNSGGRWNCPICRSDMDVAPGGLRYTCFCGRVTSPILMVGVTPHSCGRECRCGELCHPGPCSSTAY